MSSPSGMDPRKTVPIDRRPDDALGSGGVSSSRRMPPGPAAPCHPSENIFHWINREFERFGGIFHASAYGGTIYVISDPQHVDHVLRVNWQNYRKGFAVKRIEWLLGKGLMVSEGAFWKSQRRMIQPAFHDEVIQTLMKVIVAVNEELLEKWKQAAREGATVNVTTDISHMILKIVLLSIFGEDYDQVASPFSILSDVSARNLQFADAFRPLRRVVLEIASRRQQANRDGADFLGILLESRRRGDGGLMNDIQLASEVMTLIVAGHETTAATLAWVWFLLSENPEAADKLAAELTSRSISQPIAFADLSKFTWPRLVIEETLRLYPPGWLMTRKALHDDSLGEYFVPAGTELYISPWLIQRNPAYWDEPTRFDPHRFDTEASQSRHPMTMIPFSAGPRKCIGESFARLEMQVHLIMIASVLRLTCLHSQQIELDAGVNLRNKHDFIMLPQLRNESPEP